MCIAIYKPKGEEVSKDRLRNSFNRNPHGAGFAFAEGAGKVHIRKGFFTFDQFWKALPLGYQGQEEQKQLPSIPPYKESRHDPQRNDR
jgi:hypothetical protein